MGQTNEKSSIGNGAFTKIKVMSTERSLSVAKLIWAGNTKYFDPYLSSLGPYKAFYMKLVTHILSGMHLPNKKTMIIEKLS